MIAVFNPGSSSLKYKVFDPDSNFSETLSGSVNNIGDDDFADHAVAAKYLAKEIKNHKVHLNVIAYRIVHGGGLLENGVQATEKNIKILESFSSLAPLHNPPAILTIKSCEPLFGHAKHLMFFDTDFFAELPDEEATYPLPLNISSDLKIRRFGFHGISHKYAMKKSDPQTKSNIITIHLGAGCSIAAIKRGKPIATSLGFTPDEGLMMQTRSGDIDPGIIFFLIEKYGMDRTREIIEKESGLRGVSGTDGNMLNVLYAAGLKIEDPAFKPKMIRTEKGIKNAKFALELYVRRIQKYVTYYTFLLGSVDKLIFTGMIGAGSSVIRNMIVENFDRLPIHEYEVIKPNEELAIALEACKKEY
ncbi:MAG: hypothetical protein WC080_00185 [Patescibacteria group bacterium]